MELRNYLKEIKNQDKQLKYQKINGKVWEDVSENVLNSPILLNIEGNVLPSLVKLEPFMSRPLIIIYHALDNSLYFSKKIPCSELRKRVEDDYIKKFGERLKFAAECFNKNIETIIKNTINKDVLSPEYLKKLEELEKRIELGKINRDIIQWFNGSFSAIRLKFDAEDCNFNASEARKEIREKYNVEFRNMQRERELKRRTLKI